MSAGVNCLTFLNELQMAISILGHGHPKLLFQEITHRIYSEESYYGLRRDLFLSFDSPAARVPLQIRPLRAGDIPKLFKKNKEGFNEIDLKNLLQRNLLLKSGIPMCYVATVGNDEPCYMQWLIGPQHNEDLLRYYRGGFPPLGPDEMLLEGAFTPTLYRGLGIMSSAMAKIAEKGESLGARRIITFVKNDNDGALKGSKRAGFLPFTMRTSQWRYFRRRLNFIPLSPILGGNVVKMPKVFRSGP